MSQYIVPMKIPQHCDECPFGRLRYHYPFWAHEVDVDPIDKKLNKPNTNGFVCVIDLEENGKYTKVMRGKIQGKIKKPKWCKLESVEE